MNDIRFSIAISLSIHFPLTREDRLPLQLQQEAQAFNPLPSHEGRLQKALIFFSKATHFSDITNKNIASNKIAPYLKRFLRYKNLFFLVRTSRGINVRLWFAPCFRYRISHSLFKTITVPSHQIRILHQYAQSYFYIGLPDNKNAGCPYLCL